MIKMVIVEKQIPAYTLQFPEFGATGDRVVELPEELCQHYNEAMEWFESVQAEISAILDDKAWRGSLTAAVS